MTRHPDEAYPYGGMRMAWSAREAFRRRSSGTRKKPQISVRRI